PMMVLNLILLYASSFFVLAFFIENLKDFDRGTGYHYLLLSVVCLSLAFLLSNGYGLFRIIKKSTVLLGCFLLYFILKLVIDLDSFEDIVSFTLGTSSGVIFS